MIDEVAEPIGTEVRDADGLGQALAVDLLHRPPLAVIVAERLVDEVEIDVVQPELAQAALGAGPQVVGSQVLHPHLGRDPDLVAVDAGGREPAADLFLVLVHRGGVDVAVAGVQRVGHGLLGLAGVDLEDAEPDGGNLDAADGLREWGGG